MIESACERKIVRGFVEKGPPTAFSVKATRIFIAQGTQRQPIALKHWLAFNEAWIAREFQQTIADQTATIRYF